MRCPLAPLYVAELQQEHLTHAEQLYLHALMQAGASLQRLQGSGRRRVGKRVQQFLPDQVKRPELFEAPLTDVLQLALDQ